MRTRASALSDGRMKVVSERLNCAARFSIVASSMPRASSNTQSWLPLKVVDAKTLSRRKA
ncbi:hypothetical protein D3C77_647290 [compost metagenome]